MTVCYQEQDGTAVPKPMKLEFSASVGLIPKEYVTMHGHTIVERVIVH